MPYPEGFERVAEGNLRAQASSLAETLTRGGVPAHADREIIALIAYLERLGTDIKAAPAIASAVPGARTGGH